MELTSVGPEIPLGRKSQRLVLTPQRIRMVVVRRVASSVVHLWFVLLLLFFVFPVETV
jgi:hypothetical protein